MGEKDFCMWIILCIFAPDFRSEINEALYLRLASRNVRNFYDMQGWYDGSRVLAWTVPISLYQGNSHDLYSEKRCTAPRFLYCCHLWCGMANKNWRGNRIKLPQLKWKLVCVTLLFSLFFWFRVSWCQHITISCLKTDIVFSSFACTCRKVVAGRDGFV